MVQLLLASGDYLVIGAIILSVVLSVLTVCPIMPGGIFFHELL